MMDHDQEPDEHNEAAHLHTSREEMESLVLGDDHHLSSNGTSSSSSSSTSASAPPPQKPLNHHPLSSPPEISTAGDCVAFSDSFISPSPSQNHQNPNSTTSLNSFLDPPSYADAMFRSFDGDASEFDVYYGSRSSDSEYIHISVSDPENVLETSSSLVSGAGSYYTYLITTSTNVPEFEATEEFSVRRRFRDVVTLSDRLAEAYRGYFIPLRPDKSVVESQTMQKNEFVEQRRVALEKYLRKLAVHPVIRKGDELRVFLRVQGRFPLPRTIDVASRMLDGAVKLPKQLLGDSTTVVAPEEVVQPAKGGTDLLRFFKELRQAVANDWSSSRPPVVEEDKEFLEKKEKLLDLEQQLTNVSLHAESLVKAQQDIGETIGELGLAFVKLTKIEIEEALHESQNARALDMKIVATAAVKAGRLYRELNAQTVKHLDKLHDYLGMMLAIDNAFGDRSNALLTVQTLVSEISSLQSRIEKLEVASSKIFGGDKSRLHRIEELKETVKVTEDAKYCAVKEYERIKENNKCELERLGRERKADFLNMLKGFVINQAGYAGKMAIVWSKVAEDTSAYVKASSVDERT